LPELNIPCGRGVTVHRFWVQRFKVVRPQYWSMAPLERITGRRFKGSPFSGSGVELSILLQAKTLNREIYEVQGCFLGDPEVLTAHQFSFYSMDVPHPVSHRQRG
jgi:hypothetical protein